MKGPGWVLFCDQWDFGYQGGAFLPLLYQFGLIKWLNFDQKKGQQKKKSQQKGATEKYRKKKSQMIIRE